jgi:hypothetical protein
VAHVGCGEVHTGFWWGNQRERALGEPRLGQYWNEPSRNRIVGGDFANRIGLTEKRDK